jgi:hypothetical protein
VAHVGDSRAYFVRSGHIWPLTKDHSVVQQLLDQGAITPEQAILHPEGNKITRALGMKPDTDVELRDPPLLPAVGDIFILATDGLCDLVRTEEIGSVVMQAASLDLAGQNLVAMANARGGHDNITVLLARVLPPGASGATVSHEPVAPTIVESAISGGAPEKTLVDRPPGPPPAVAPFAPTPPAVAPSSPSAAVGPITEPLHVAQVPPGAQVRAPAPASLPNTVPPAPPSRSGLLVAFVVMMVVFLAGIVVWWILRGR